MKVGIVGHGADKFSQVGYARATWEILEILESHPGCTLVSGHSPVGGIDIWAEETAKKLGLELDLKIPRQKTWDAEYGFKQRNLDIARCSDELHVILVDVYPLGYKGRVFTECYHCHTADHVKSGACWTGLQAQAMGKDVLWHIIRNRS